MAEELLKSLTAAIAEVPLGRSIGRVCAVDESLVWVKGFSNKVALGDHLMLRLSSGNFVRGEVIRLHADRIAMMAHSGPEGVCLGDEVQHIGPMVLRPAMHWIGRVITPYGQALDGHPIVSGPSPAPMKCSPPNPSLRDRLGSRLHTGLNVFDTILPIAKGQRVGLFAGSGVGKSQLLARLVQNMEADVVVLALVGERGREVRDFVESAIGPEGMKRCIVVAATSDRSPLERKACMYTAVAISEFLSARNKHVLLLADSLTRFAEAHREVAIASGELPALRGYPASVSQELMELCERTGPGVSGTGAITAVFSILVAGSDMESPVADILRGTLDGHIVLDRSIAEEGRYPAVDVLQSVSRCLPEAASLREQGLLGELRSLLATRQRSLNLIKSGLYRRGSDPTLDRAIELWPRLSEFIYSGGAATIEQAFAELSRILQTGELPNTPPSALSSQGLDRGQQAQGNALR